MSEEFINISYWQKEYNGRYYSDIYHHLNTIDLEIAIYDSCTGYIVNSEIISLGIDKIRVIVFDILNNASIMLKTRLIENYISQKTEDDMSSNCDFCIPIKTRKSHVELNFNKIEYMKELIDNYLIELQ